MEEPGSGRYAGVRSPEATMPDPVPAPQDSRPAEKTQILGPDALRSAQTSGAETPADQATPILPAGLPIPPPTGDEPTRPMPVDPKGPSAEDATEALAIIEGPDATVKLPAGTPATPPELGATIALLVGEPAPPPSETRILPPDVRTMEIPPDKLPAPGRKRMPLWGWAALAALVLLLGFGGIYFLRPDLLGQEALEAQAQESSESPATPESSAMPAPETAEKPVGEIPPALRSYFEKAQKGDAASMRMLGVMYYNGLNVPRNEPEGLRWYRKAAEAGSQAAQKELKLLEAKAPAR